MKPTVINNSNSENSAQPNQEQHSTDNTSSNNINNNVGSGGNDSRRFPQFRHGFGFDDPDEDVFGSMGLRSRMNRMGHPFDWSARKRRGSGQNATDAYDQYFHDDVDFPHFGSTWDAFNRVGNKRTQHPTADVNDRSGFFDYLPPEFRQYIPDNFGFGAGMRHGQHAQPYQAQAAPPQNQQQFYEPTAPSKAAAPSTSANSSRSNLCDAAIQTEDPSTPTGNDRNKHQNGAPSTAAAHQNSNNASASSSNVSTPRGNQMHTSTTTDGPNAYANASASNPQTHQYSQSPQQPYYQQNPGRQYQQQPQNQFYYRQPNTAPVAPAASATSPSTVAPAAPPSPSPAAPTSTAPAKSNQTQGDNFVRNVPIFIEGSNAPVNKTTKPRPDPIVCKEAPPMQHEQQQVPVSHSSDQMQGTNTNDKNDTTSEPVPPQTPHTADCISKIQAIQRDVLDLMCAVEQFGGKRGDKEYGYLDEMLTRNLLKLDTIDTNGKESIRMARKEAIKCIQASIAVLEAKADLNLNENQENASAAAANAVETDKQNESYDEALELGKSEVIALPPAPEKMDTSELNQQKPVDEHKVDYVAAEIPKVQENVENITIGDKASADKIAVEGANIDAAKISMDTNENTSETTINADCCTK